VLNVKALRVRVAGGISVKMDNSEPFLFAGVRGQTNWMHGAEEVKLTDLPNGGIFRWSTFALVVAE